MATVLVKAITISVLDNGHLTVLNWSVSKAELGLKNYGLSTCKVIPQGGEGSETEKEENQYMMLE